MAATSTTPSSPSSKPRAVHTKAADAGATAAVECRSRGAQPERSLTPSVVAESDCGGIEAVTPAFLAQIGRDLIRGGASLHRIDDGHLVAGCGCARSRSVVLARGPLIGSEHLDSSGHRVRPVGVGDALCCPGPRSYWPTMGLVHRRARGYRRGPASWAPLTAKLAAESERSLGDEGRGAGRQHRADPARPRRRRQRHSTQLKQLRSTSEPPAAKPCSTETVSGGYGEGRTAAPMSDWKPQRLGPDPPSHDGHPEPPATLSPGCSAACGTVVALFDSSDGTAQREALEEVGTWAPCEAAGPNCSSTN